MELIVENWAVKVPKGTDRTELTYWTPLSLSEMRSGATGTLGVGVVNGKRQLDGRFKSNKVVIRRAHKNKNDIWIVSDGGICYRLLYANKYSSLKFPTQTDTEIDTILTKIQ
jgi:hypothetical protein